MNLKDEHEVFIAVACGLLLFLLIAAGFDLPLEVKK